MSKNFSFEKSFFVFSFAVLTFLYGFAACAWNLFPKQTLLAAWGQAEQTGIVSRIGQYLPGSPGDPHFLHPQVHEHTGVRILEPEKIQPGLTFISAVGWEPELKLIDREGNVVHQWKVDYNELTGSINEPAEVHGSHLLPNGDLIINLSYVGTARVDACGRVQWKTSLQGHHSVDQAEDGSFWVSGKNYQATKKSTKYPNGFPGINKPIHLDQIHHISKNGQSLDKINVLDIIYSKNLERYISRAYFLEGIEKDITHLNDVEPLGSSLADEYPLFESGDLLVSVKHLNLVFVFDPESSVVKWHASSPFIAQHDPDFMGNGWIGIFDNRPDFTGRGTMLGGSRIVALQPHTDSTEVLFPTARSDTFYTPAAGKWQKLENGNMLLTEAFAGRVVEVSPNGSVVWDWVHGPKRNEKVPEVMEGTRYDLTREEVASWPCSSVDSERTSTTR